MVQKPKPTAKRTSGASMPRKSGDWREETLARMRALILEADPEMTEERKWAKQATPTGVPAFSHNGLV